MCFLNKMSKLNSLLNFVNTRSISLSAPREGKRNFRKFVIANKRGSRIHKQQQAGPNRLLEIDKRGVRDTGYVLDNKFHLVPEMIPELIVPDLKDCQLKPYVSYKAADVTQSEFTAEQMFLAVYSRKIVEDFKAGKLNEVGEPLEPSNEEKITADEAVAKARSTGSDIF